MGCDLRQTNVVQSTAPFGLRRLAKHAAGGGGIQNTVTQTREHSEDDLIDEAAARLRHLLSEGVRRPISDGASESRL